VEDTHARVAGEIVKRPGPLPTRRSQGRDSHHTYARHPAGGI